MYPHEATENIKKINKKGPDGQVLLEAKNFFTSPPRLGSAMVTPGVLIGGNSYEYVSDPFDRKHQIYLAEINKNKAKLKSEVFKTNGPGLQLFFDDKTTYGEVPQKKSIKKATSYAYLKHDTPFIPSNPSKKGATIGKFPEYMPNPITSPTRRPPSEQIPWRHTINGRTKPSPSVTNLLSNLRSEYPVLRKNH